MRRHKNRGIVLWDMNSQRRKSENPTSSILPDTVRCKGAFFLTKKQKNLFGRRAFRCQDFSQQQHDHRLAAPRSIPIVQITLVRSTIRYAMVAPKTKHPQTSKIYVTCLESDQGVTIRYSRNDKKAKQHHVPRTRREGDKGLTTY